MTLATIRSVGSGIVARMALDPTRSVLLCMDFQRDICAPGGRMISDDPAVHARFAAAVDRAVVLRAAFRARGFRVAHVQHVFSPGYPELEGKALAACSAS